MLTNKLPRLLLSPEDVNSGGESSVTPDVNGGNSSAQEQDVNGQTTEGNTTEQSSEATGTQGDTTESSDQSTGTSDDQQNTGEQEQTQEEQSVLTDKEGDDKLPFGRHPRFQELIKAKNDAQAEATNYKSHAERAQILDNYLTTNGISPQDFTRTLDFLRLRRIDPNAALQLMRPDLEQLQQLTGEKLPADLESRVAAGMDVEIAKELARRRAQDAFNQTQSADQQNIAAQQHDMMINSAFSAFDTMMRGTDPDFRPKRAQADPDGLWEFVSAKLVQLRTMAPPRNTMEAQRLAKNAYDEVKKSLARYAPPRPNKRAIGSKSSSSNANAVVKTADDVVKAIIAGRRPHELRYG